ncbi:hypothetical protein G9A89_003018 [Geosiphon pyriformis]|nr:hypothetical protein G9A89_003018 [Geosiphon pyriformis]
MYKSKLAKKTSIKNAVEKCMEKFCLDKDGIIRSVLDYLFYKVVLDYLVVDDELVLEPKKMKSDVDKIMKNWTRKYVMLPVLPDLWARHLSDGYRVHDEFDQDEIFLPFLWRIFYNPLLCEVKKHEQLCKYRINTKFVSKTDKIESSDGITSCFAAGIFVDNTIWIGNCQAFTQYALNIASEFFIINDISINSKKTVAIPINQGVKVASLSICEQLISIAKKSKAHCYLRIFLSIKRLFKPSVARAYSDVCFFVNVLLKKTVSDKQFSYLVSAVLQPIGLKSKACLPRDFLSEALYHPFLYDLKSFEQVLDWASLDSLQFPVKLCVSSVNNFLAGVVRIFLNNMLSLVNILSSVFCNPGVFLMILVLGKSLFFDSVCSLKHFEIFVLTSKFLNDKGSLESVSVASSSSLPIWFGNFEVYMDSSLKSAGSADVVSGAAAYFLVLDIGVNMRVQGLFFSTMTELQAVVLALECVLFSCSVDLYLDSQAAIDTCVSEMLFDKDFIVYWIKIKDHSGIASNVKTDTFASEAADSPVFLPVGVQKHFLITENMAMFGNTCHFSVMWIGSPPQECGIPIYTCLQGLLVGNVGLYLVICKSFMLKDWCEEAVGVFDEKEKPVNFSAYGKGWFGW